MKRLHACLVSVVAIAIATTSSSALASAHLDNPNLLVDTGFEGALTFDGPPFVGTWEGFSAGGVSSSEFSTDMPRNGAQSLELNIVGNVNLFAGAFQDVNFPAGLEGTPAWFSGWHKLIGDSGGTEVRIEWRDSVAGTEVARTPNLATSPVGSDYEEFVLSASIPAGADSARLVYAIQSFGGALNQQVFVDDVNFNIQGIPEPHSFALFGLASLALSAVRRRS